MGLGVEGKGPGYPFIRDTTLDRIYKTIKQEIKYIYPWSILFDSRSYKNILPSHWLNFVVSLFCNFDPKERINLAIK